MKDENNEQPQEVPRNVKKNTPKRSTLRVLMSRLGSAFCFCCRGENETDEDPADTISSPLSPNHFPTMPLRSCLKNSSSTFYSSCPEFTGRIAPIRDATSE
ncbi:uncharacterized protein LOC124162547 [Ischnura elegans]|uniref:uncharacterized protein LOC124162547 n=1 Tax=Ischnura elegans TaxID=197161 RepID=UPI001ED8A1FC|nr:uncharacterized protein LOC124162547 [Ischnura elegans]